MRLFLSKPALLLTLLPGSDKPDSIGKAQKFLPAPDQEVTVVDYEVEEVGDPELARVR